MTMTATSAERRVVQFNSARLTLHREPSTMEAQSDVLEDDAEGLTQSLHESFVCTVQ